MPPKRKSSPSPPRRSPSPSKNRKTSPSPSKKSPVRRRRPPMSLKPFYSPTPESKSTQVYKLSTTSGRFPSFYYSQPPSQMSPKEMKFSSSRRRTISPIMGQPIQFFEGDELLTPGFDIPSSTGGSSSGRGRFYRTPSPTF